MLHVVTHEGVPADGDVAARWDELVEADPLGTTFHGPAYLRLWADELGQRNAVRVHELRDGATTVGFVPVALQREGSATGPSEVVRFLGGTDVTDYVGPVCLPEHRDAVAETYAARLAADADWDEFVASGLVEDSGWPQAWERGCEAAGLQHVDTADEDVCPRLDLTGGYPAYLERLGGRLRQEMKRKTRKLARDAGELELFEVPVEQHDEALERFFTMNQELPDDKGHFFARDEMRAWFHRLSDGLGPAGVLRIHELHVGGLPAAAGVSLVEHGEWGLYNSAYDATLGSLAPGMVIVALLAEQAAAEGCEVLDLLRGDEEYKYRFGPVERRLLAQTWVRP